MAITLFSKSWDFPHYSLNKHEAFGNIYLLYAEAKLKGIPMDDNDAFSDAAERRKNFFMDKFYSYIADNYQPGCFITVETVTQKPYYMGDSNGKYLVRPALIDRVLRDVFTKREFQPNQDEQLISQKINDWMDTQRSEKIYLDQYVSKTLNQRVGSFLDSFTSPFKTAVSSVVNKYQDVKQKFGDAKENVKEYDPFEKVDQFNDK